jgi:hypothetical protein
LRFPKSTLVGAARLTVAFWPWISRTGTQAAAGTRTRTRMGDHDGADLSYGIAKRLGGTNRHICNQWLRAGAVEDRIDAHSTDPADRPRGGAGRNRVRVGVRVGVRVEPGANKAVNSGGEAGRNHNRQLIVAAGQSCRSILGFLVLVLRRQPVLVLVLEWRIEWGLMTGFFRSLDSSYSYSGGSRYSYSYSNGES